MKSDHNARQLPQKYDYMAVNSRQHYVPFNPPLYPEYAGFSRWSGSHGFARTNSELFCVELVTRGNASFSQAGRTYLVEPGSVFVLRKGCAHRYGVGPARVLHKRFVVMAGPMLEMLLHSLGLTEHDVIRPSFPARIAALMKGIVSAFERPDERTHIHVSKLAYELLLELSLSCHPRYPQVIDKALAFMESRLSGQVSSSEICGHAGLSATHLNRLFRQYVGMSPMTYFVRQKMAWARHLLSETALSVKEIAAMIGYEDPLYFSAQFKNHEAVSPRNFRQRKMSGPGDAARSDHPP